MNSVTVPDKKVKAGTRYRLASLEHLSEKFLADCERVDDDISYSQFCRYGYVPEKIIKPKPGTHVYV